jgi:hypothetical protein
MVQEFDSSINVWIFEYKSEYSDPCVWKVKIGSIIRRLAFRDKNKNIVRMSNGGMNWHCWLELKDVFAFVI